MAFNGLFSGLRSSLDSHKSLDDVTVDTTVTATAVTTTSALTTAASSLTTVPTTSTILSRPISSLDITAAEVTKTSQPDWICHLCKATLPNKPRKNVVICPGCKAPYHPSCSKKVSVLPDGNFSRCCSDIQQPSNSTLAEAIDDRLSLLLREIQSTIQETMKVEIANRLDDLSRSMTSVVDRIGALEAVADEVVHLSQKVSSMEARLSELESKAISSSASGIGMPATSSAGSSQDIYQELEDRRRRSYNVMVMGLAEPTDPHRPDDLAVFNRVLEDLPKASSARRLGRNVNGRPRPLKVTFASPEDARLILKNSGAFVRKSLRVKNDLTPCQLSELDGLRKQLDVRIQNGEKDLTIKYVNSVPVIIRKKNM